MKNLLLKVASEKEIDARLDRTFKRMFSQSSSERIYFEENDMAYIVDTGNNDVRTEGMSYGMMIAVQLNKPKMFRKIWEWVKTYMAFPEKSENEGYFIWSCSTKGVPNDNGPAPDGEEYFAMALLLAEKRWDRLDYGEEARGLLRNMVHKGEGGEKGNAMFDPETYYIRFVPSLNITDPSYHLPHFYKFFSKWGNREDEAFFKEATKKSREFLLKAANNKTGLTPEYATYDGQPYNLDGHWTFFSDSYRTVANIGLDWAWYQEDQEQRKIALNAQHFFEKYIAISKDKIPVFKIDGSLLSNHEQTAQKFPPLMVKHPIGLFATLAQASLATLGIDEKLANKWIKEFWNLDLQVGKYRYYDNLLYFFALIALSGHYKKEW